MPIQELHEKLNTVNKNTMVVKKQKTLFAIFISVMWTQHVGVLAQEYNINEWWNNWFDQNHNWDDLDRDLGSNIISEEYGRLQTKWHQVCDPNNHFCDADTDCAWDEVCENFECISHEEYHLYGVRCSNDEQCLADDGIGRKLVCCDQEGSKQKTCCYPSEKEQWAELACQENNDCCTENDISYCCKWTAGPQWGTCCTYEQMTENTVTQHCSDTSCGYRMKCCPGDMIGGGYPDYCCTPAEYRLVTDGGDQCMQHSDCYSGFCCSNDKCCTHEEYETDMAMCYLDTDCYRTQECCYLEQGESHCCYTSKETDDGFEFVMIVIVGAVVFLFLVVIITIGVVCCYYVKQNGKKAKKKKKKNRVADQPLPTPVSNNMHMQGATFLYNQPGAMNTATPPYPFPGNPYGAPAPNNYAVNGNVVAPPGARLQALVLPSTLPPNGIPQPPVYNPPVFQ